MFDKKPAYADHYEVLQLSQNADRETVERVYRLLAKRYHPDNGDSGDEERFRQVRAAYEVLSDPERRAEFDVHHDEQRRVKWSIFEQGAEPDTQQQDQRIFRGVLSLLYAARRRNPNDGGLGPIYFEEMLGVPREHLEFPIWYLKKKGLVETLQSGELAITIAGIDSLEERRTVPDNRLLNPSTGAVDGATPSRRADDDPDVTVTYVRTNGPSASSGGT